MEKKLILIDGHALIFRSYYAFLRRPMVNSKGADTSIIFGFTKAVLELILKERPTHLAVAFDPPAKTFRHELYPEYKANRQETPQLIKDALNPLTEILEAISIPVLMKPGYEADDVIGTIAKRASQDGLPVYMVTPDKDFGQLIDKNIYQYKPAKSGSDNELINRERICEQYGIDDPSQIIDILTIWGDSSDNIPGVRGIGEIGSKRLISKYKSIDNIYNSLDELPPKQQEAFTEARSYIELSRKLITINTDVEMVWEKEDYKLETPHFNHIKELFTYYEFPSLARMLPSLEQMFNLTDRESSAEGSIKQDTGNQYNSLIASIEELTNSVKTKGYLSFIICPDNLLLSCDGKSHFSEYNSAGLNKVKALFEDSSIIKCGYDIKSLINLLRREGIRLKGYQADIELMHYLLAPERSHKIELLAATFLNTQLTDYTDEEPADLFSQTEDKSVNIKSQLKEAAILYPLYEVLKSMMAKEDIESLYNKIEMPLIEVLANMEYEGVKIDEEMLGEYSKELTAELISIEKQVRELADEPILNISSPKQLGVVLFEKLKLKKGARKTQSKNYSTDEETLNELYNVHPIIPQILEYRNIKKLLTTYIDPFPSLISPETGKIHTTYKQSLTATGRLSSVKPNLQNIPIRSERGREIRKAFISSHKNGIIISADYSQIELRLMAHMSEDPSLIEAFKEEMDIHAATASKIFKIAPDELSKEQRNRAKVANFGIIYGISAFGLSQRLGIPRAESKKLIEDYFAAYPGVESYIKETIGNAKMRGYVSTLYGRKRYLPDINSKNPVVRGLAERNAINAPIQGSAADIIKVAMIRVERKIKEAGLKSRMVLQVHDELLFDALRDEERELTKIIKEEMEGVIVLKVPLTIECKSGLNWLEAH